MRSFVYHCSLAAPACSCPTCPLALSASCSLRCRSRPLALALAHTLRRGLSRPLATLALATLGRVVFGRGRSPPPRPQWWRGLGSLSPPSTFSFGSRAVLGRSRGFPIASAPYGRSARLGAVALALVALGPSPVRCSGLASQAHCLIGGCAPSTPPSLGLAPLAAYKGAVAPKKVRQRSK